MTKEVLYFVGVDGGGTHCRARVVTREGVLVGEATGGSANIFSDLDGALASVGASVVAALRAGGLDASALSLCAAGLGLAGANIPSVAAAFAARPTPFAAVRLASDAVTACLGAHDGADGGLAILGTGTAYVAKSGERFAIFGGWGTAVSDHGSAAVIGRAALVRALLAHDGVGHASPMTDAVLSRFETDAARLASFGRSATPSELGALAPLVFDTADAHDPVAASVVAEALAIVEASLRRLLDLGAPAIALVGGVAPRYAPRLAPDLSARIVPAKGSALDGALILARAAA